MSTGFDTADNPPFQVYGPAVQRVPYVLNSPHSGRCYPQEFLRRARLSHLSIRKSEDYRVDELFCQGIELGMPMLAANFPRAYLDVNREPYELDPKMFSGRLPDYVNTASVRVAGGLGTIARVVSENEEIYHSAIPVTEGLERINQLYKPYHATLRRLLAKTHVEFGFCVLIDCHSMPSAKASGNGEMRPDVIVGDRYGSSCAPELSQHIRNVLAEMGYRVEFNKPYAGGFITQHYGRPENGLHAVQIEVNRGLYMDELRMRKSANFERFAKDMRTLLERVISMPETSLLGAMPLAAE